MAIQILRDICPWIDELYAHTRTHKGTLEIETLWEHSERVFTVFQYICNKQDIEGVLHRILGDFFWVYRGRKFLLQQVSKDLIDEMFKGVIYMHDIGKINPAYQDRIVKNVSLLTEHIPHRSVLDSPHSPLSTAIFLQYFYAKTKNISQAEERLVVQYIMMVCSYVIYTHHGSLADMDDWLGKVNSKVFQQILSNPSYLHFFKGNKLDCQH